MILSINFSGKPAKALIIIFSYLLAISACAPIKKPLNSGVSSGKNNMPALIVVSEIKGPLNSGVSSGKNNMPALIVVSEIKGTPDNSLPPGVKNFHLAVLPIENLSGEKVPIIKIEELLKAGLKKGGLNILDDEVLEGFMSRKRLRYTGALDIETARAFKKEVSADAVLITTLELYDENYPPKFSFISRLVSTGDVPEILWMDSIGLTGYDSPGFLGLGLIEDFQGLLDKAIQKLSGSLTAYLSDTKEKFSIRRERKISVPVSPLASSPVEFPYIGDSSEKTEPMTQVLRFDPKTFYRSPILSPNMKYKIAVLPFLNKSERKNAGEIIMLNFINQLRVFKKFDVIEPGIIRQDLLNHRVILDEGISYSNADVIFATLGVDADLILTGTVMDYQDYRGPEGSPKVDFSVVIIERNSREVVFISKSYDVGNEGVFFFDYGKKNTANVLSSEMIKAVVELITE